MKNEPKRFYRNKYFMWGVVVFGLLSLAAFKSRDGEFISFKTTAPYISFQVDAEVTSGIVFEIVEGAGEDNILDISATVTTTVIKSNDPRELHLGSYTYLYLDTSTTISGILEVEGATFRMGGSDSADHIEMSFVETTGNLTYTVGDLGAAGNFVLSTTKKEAVCGSVSIDLPDIVANTSGSATATVTGVPNDTPCWCSPRVIFDDDIVMNFCNTDAGLIRVNAYNPTGGNIDPAAVTVDYCCFE